mmetsp:Transcript_118990/g.381271  ORF Transcript_118990/g.381271 Transcript_118990/m.381271 type:complete len:528 (-) Transcript_118990:910-2493(-)
MHLRRELDQLLDGALTSILKYVHGRLRVHAPRQQLGHMPPCGSGASQSRLGRGMCRLRLWRRQAQNSPQATQRRDVARCLGRRLSQRGETQQRGLCQEDRRLDQWDQDEKAPAGMEGLLEVVALELPVLEEEPELQGLGDGLEHQRRVLAVLAPGPGLHAREAHGSGGAVVREGHGGYRAARRGAFLVRPGEQQQLHARQQVPHVARREQRRLGDRTARGEGAQGARGGQRGGQEAVALEAGELRHDASQGALLDPPATGDEIEGQGDRSLLADGRQKRRIRATSFVVGLGHGNLSQKGRRFFDDDAVQLHQLRHRGSAALPKVSDEGDKPLASHAVHLSVATAQDTEKSGRLRGCQPEVFERILARQTNHSSNARHRGQLERVHQLSFQIHLPLRLRDLQEGVHASAGAEQSLEVAQAAALDQGSLGKHILHLLDADTQLLWESAVRDTGAQGLHLHLHRLQGLRQVAQHLLGGTSSPLGGRRCQGQPSLRLQGQLDLLQHALDLRAPGEEPPLLLQHAQCVVKAL